MESKKQKPMDDLERLKLAEKLDSELDGFINSLERKPYKDGWSEDNWKQEIEKHPFFMTKSPEPGEEIHPLLEGLVNLKFDPDNNSPEELAEKYKEDGNYWMKHKKYRIAILNYTEGIQQKPSNTDLIANLYNNRSAAHYFLKNYRTSHTDAQKAIQHKNDYHKAKIRMLKCNMELKKYDEILKEIEHFLSQDPTNVDFVDIQKEAINKNAEKLRDERRNQMIEKKKRQDNQRLVQALIQRKVKFEEIPTSELCKLSSIDIITPKIEPLEKTPVNLDKLGNLYWPVVFCYPEYEITDIKQQVHEMETVYECLEDIFTSDDDNAHNYKNVQDMNVYFENRLKGQISKADSKKTLKEIISDDNFWIYNGYLTFYVIPKNSKTEVEFLNQKRRPQCVNKN